MSDCDELCKEESEENPESLIDKIRNLPNDLPQETTIFLPRVHLGCTPVSFLVREPRGECKAYRRSLWTVEGLSELGNVPQSSIYPPASRGMRVRPQPRDLKCSHDVVSPHDIPTIFDTYSSFGPHVCGPDATKGDEE